ncbi:virB8 family protein [Aliarcobacter butzleri]
MATKIITDDNFNEKDALDFEDSRNYLMIKSNKRAWLVAYISLVLTVMLGIAIMFLTPLKTVELTVVKVDKNGHVEIVTNLNEIFITGDEALDKHFIGQYVKTREQYYFATLNKDFEKVQLFSSPKVAKEYVHFMLDKKTGRAEQLKDNKEISVNILSIVPKKIAGELTATIRIDVIEKDKNGSILGTVTKIVTLTYDYLPMKLDMKERLENPLGFAITSYRTDEEIKE